MSDWGIQDFFAKQDSSENEDNLYRKILQSENDFIRCDSDETNPDLITIRPLPGISSKEFDVSKKKLNSRIRKLFRCNFKTKIYEIKPKTVDGQNCIFVDFSKNPKETRTNICLFLLRHVCFSIEMDIKTKNFPERQEQFQRVLDTVKFTKK